MNQLLTEHLFIGFSNSVIPAITFGLFRSVSIYVKPEFESIEIFYLAAAASFEHPLHQWRRNLFLKC